MLKELYIYIYIYYLSQLLFTTPFLLIQYFTFLNYPPLFLPFLSPLQPHVPIAIPIAPLFYLFIYFFFSTPTPHFNLIFLLFLSSFSSLSTQFPTPHKLCFFFFSFLLFFHTQLFFYFFLYFKTK